MKLFKRKSKEEKEIEREFAYRKAKGVVKNYISKSEDLKRQYWQQGVEAAKIGDEELLKRFAAGYYTMNEKLKKARKLLINMEGIKIQREAVKLSSEFVHFAKDMSDSILEGTDLKDIAKTQLELENAMAKAEQIDLALSTALDMTSETILSAPELTETSLESIIKTMGKEAETGESDLDIKIEEKIKQVEEAMRKGK